MSNPNQCQCTTSKKKRCTREVETKPGKDKRYCWQHQKCKVPFVTKGIKVKSPPKLKSPVKPKSPVKQTTRPKLRRTKPEKSELMKIVEAPDRLRRDTCLEGKLVEYYKANREAGLQANREAGGWGDAVVVKCHALGAIIRDVPTGKSFFFAYPFMRLEDHIQHNQPFESIDQCQPGMLVYFMSRNDVILYGKINRCEGTNISTNILTPKYRANVNTLYNGIYPYKGDATTQDDLPLNPDSVIPK
jgi:hypothetical protein